MWFESGNGDLAFVKAFFFFFGPIYLCNQVNGTVPHCGGIAEDCAIGARSCIEVKFAALSSGTCEKGKCSGYFLHFYSLIFASRIHTLFLCLK